MALSNIVTGWVNFSLDFFNQLHPKIKEEGEKRLEICSGCPMRTLNKCDKTKTGINIESGLEVKGCSCNLSAKVLDPNSECPKGLWKKYKI